MFIFNFAEYQNRLNDCALPDSDVSTSPEKKSSGTKSPKTPKGPRKRKKGPLFTRKPKKTVYQNQPPELETLKSINEGSLDTINQQLEHCPPIQLNTDVENLNNNCTDFTPEICNVSGNVKSFDTENERTGSIEEGNKPDETATCIHGENKDEMPKDIEINVSMGTSISGETTDLLDKNSKSGTVQGTGIDKVTATDNKSKSPRKGKNVKPVTKRGRKGKKSTKKNDNGSDTDTTIEWGERPGSPGIPKLEENSAKNIKKEPEEFMSKAYLCVLEYK